MKAAERLRRYGAKAYAKQRGKVGEEAEKEVKRVKEVFGEKIPIKRPTKYKTTTWKINFEDEKGEFNNITLTGESHLHQEPDTERDIEEAINNAKKENRLTYNWKAVDAHYITTTPHYLVDKQAKIPTEPTAIAQEPKEPTAKQEVKQKVEKVGKEKLTKVAQAMKDAGISTTEIAKALLEIA